MPKLDFWYDFASTYSYLSAMRIADAAQAAGVAIVYRPFLLGPIFKTMGWSTSPFQIYPAKGQYMVRDITRIANDRSLSFQMPPTFPVNGLHAARIALAGEREGWIGQFTRNVFEAQFAHARDIADRAVLSAILEDLRLDPEPILERSAAPDIKEALRAQTDSAAQRGVFGAPTFITGDGEIFWGDDRLDQALAWAARAASG